MRDDKKTARQQQIEAAAYEVLESKGYGGTSMLGIARKARASNETLYNWYGDKNGLFQALVTRNAHEVKTLLEDELETENDALSILARLGPKLLKLLTGDRAVALNRAAAADSSGELGATLSKAGRETVFPLLVQVMERAKAEGQLQFNDSAEAVGLYLDLLIGDMQIRRVIGRVTQPDKAFCDMRSETAMRHLLTLLNPQTTQKKDSPMDDLRAPDECGSMMELRREIDAIDVALIKLLATRATYIDRAVALKRQENLPARTSDRVAEVLNKVAETASQHGLDPELARTLWSEIIEWSIRRELVELGEADGA